jgi:diacylglycerol O-acyltransferase 2, plant
VYYLGNTQLFSKVGGGSSGWSARLSRALRTSFVLFYGRYLLPIPYAHPITMLVGKPIAVEKIEHPTHEQVEKVHQQFVHELTSLFDRHKGTMGWHDRQLHVV